MGKSNGKVSQPRQIRNPKESTSLFDKYFKQFPEIIHNIRNLGLFNNEDDSLSSWEWHIPTKDTHFCTIPVTAYCACFLTGFSSAVLGITGCCVAIPKLAYLYAASGSVASASCCTFGRTEGWSEYRDSLKRLRAISVLNIESKLRADLFALPRFLQAQKIELGRFRIELVEIMQTLSAIRPDEVIPGLEALRYHLKWSNRPDSDRPLIQDLKLLNLARFMGIQVLDHHTFPRLSDNEEKKIQDFRSLSISQKEEVLMRDLLNVNAPEFLPQLWDHLPDENLFHGKYFYIQFAPLAPLVRAGLSIENISRNEITPKRLLHLLDAGIFVGHPRLLDQLSKDRYDLALILYFFGYQTPQITSLIMTNAYVNFRDLKRLRDKWVDDSTYHLSTEMRSTLCRNFMKTIVNLKLAKYLYKSGGNQTITRICDAIAHANKVHLKPKIRQPI